MSYRSEALAAFDAMSEDEWSWFAPRGHSLRRDLFRTYISDGRVDPKAVLANIQVACRATALTDQLAALDSIPMPVRRRGTGTSPHLEVAT